MGDNSLPALLREAADRIEELEGACREPDRIGRIVRNVGEWTPEQRGDLVRLIRARYPHHNLY